MNLGNPAENRTAAILLAHDYLPASRRHMAGPGDLLAVPKNGAHVKRRALLVEVKRTTDGPFKTFGPEDRDAMISAGVRYGVSPLLAWYGIPGPIGTAYPIWLPVEDWPP